MTPSSFANVARRRGWVVGLAVLGGLLGAFLFSLVQSSSYTAGATLLVTTDDPFESTRLAQTYADALPDDGGLLRSVSNALDAEEQQVQSSLSVEADSDTAVVRLEYRAGSEAAARRGVGVAVRSVTGASPAALSVPPNVLEVIRNPRILSSPADGVSVTTLAVGAILGLFLGLFLAVGLERSDPRTDELHELVAATGGLPVTRASGDGERLSPAVLERWRELSGQTAPLVALVGLHGMQGRGLERLVSRSAGDSRAELSAADAQGDSPRRRVAARSGGDRVGVAEPVEAPASAGGAERVTLVSGGPLGGDGSAETIAQKADLTVLAVPRGARRRDVESDLALLAQFGVEPRWALLTG